VERFIDHIPIPDFALEMGHFGRDVIIQRAQQGTGRVDAADPARQLVMPDQGMPTYLHVVGLGMGNNRVGRAEVERILRWLGRVPLHLVGSSSSSELTVEDGRVRIRAQVVDINSGTESSALRGRCRSEGSSG